MKLEELINKNYQQLNENDIYIWDYINKHRKICEQLSIDELANRCHVSRSTILRFSKRLGLKGYAELKVYLRIDNHSQQKDALLDNIYKQYHEGLEKMQNYNYHEICQVIDQAQHLFVYGTGEVQSQAASHLKRVFSMSRRLFLDIDVSADFEGYIHLFEAGDVFIAISFEGENLRLLDFVYRLKAKGVIIVAIVGNEDSTLSHVSDYYLAINIIRIITNMGKRDNLVGQYFVLIDFLVINYIEYMNRKEQL